MRIIVTGGSGFLGSEFVRVARAAGHQLAVLSRRAPPSRIGLGDELLGEKLDDTLLLGDIANPPWEQIRNFAPEACVHAAWIATPGIYLDADENWEWVDWSLSFLTELASLGVRHITALGSCIEYKITGTPLSEEATPIEPRSNYARAKAELYRRLSADFSVERTSSAPGLAWARVFHPYGAGEHPARLATSATLALRSGQPLTLRTPQSRKDFIHVGDVARALLLIVERSHLGAINIGTGDATSVEGFVQQIAKIVGRTDLVRIASDPVDDGLSYVVADSSRIRSLGWQPKISLSAGLWHLVRMVSK